MVDPFSCDPFSLFPRLPQEKFTTTLPTEVADPDGLLRRVNRATTVGLYPVLPGETPLLCEMGIPVVETGDRWHYDIGQKVPLTLDRENVPPGFLRQVRARTCDWRVDFVRKAGYNGAR
jgi:hypothetical protein